MHIVRNPRPPPQRRLEFGLLQVAVVVMEVCGCGGRRDHRRFPAVALFIVAALDPLHVAALLSPNDTCGFHPAALFLLSDPTQLRIPLASVGVQQCDGVVLLEQGELVPRAHPFFNQQDAVIGISPKQMIKWYPQLHRLFARFCSPFSLGRGVSLAPGMAQKSTSETVQVV